ncbi:nucleotidyltransferase domain-containing protein [Terrisporobacter sp.]
MKETYEVFLGLIRAGLNKEEITLIQPNWKDLLQLGYVHKLLPLIYESSHKTQAFKELDSNFRNEFKATSMQIIYSQIRKSERFLQLYEQFNKSELKVLVFKGVVLRELYPIPDERISGDEDILIKKEDLQKCIEILESNRFNRVLNNDEDADVYHYFCKKTGLHLELHTSLFGKNSSAYSHMNETFADVFSDSETIKINNTEVHTFSLDKHFLYVICHVIKHFVSAGTGIRQICDIYMYINKFYNQINWDYIWEEIIDLGYDTLFVNFLQIMIDYLGLDENKIKYCNDKNVYYINTENIIEDIMEGGIYGASSQSRLNAANMSLDALNNESNSKLNSNLVAIFPKADNLKKRYKYLNNYPFLLPLAWINRICTYIKERGSITSVGATVKETIEVGNRRIDLLKEYKLIK